MPPPMIKTHRYFIDADLYDSKIISSIPIISAGVTTNSPQRSLIRSIASDTACVGEEKSPSCSAPEGDTPKKSDNLSCGKSAH
jgi:hypothetical protein